MDNCLLTAVGTVELGKRNIAGIIAGDVYVCTDSADKYGKYKNGENVAAHYR